MAFEVAVPSLARPVGPERASNLADAPSDLVAFHVATAQPLTQAAPLLELIQLKLDERTARRRRSSRLAACEVSRKYLVHGADPAESSSAERIAIRGHGTTTDEIAETATDVVEHFALFSDLDCDRLVAHARRHLTSNVPDSVDDAPEYQVNLTTPELDDLLGDGTSERLKDLPTAWSGARDRLLDTDRMNVFIRLFTTDTRENLSFHNDVSGITVNVPLEADPIDGGKLLMLYGGALHEAPRERGVALCHDSRVIHGVSRMKNGERWSLIAFFPTLDARTGNDPRPNIHDHNNHTHEMETTCPLATCPTSKRRPSRPASLP